MSIIKPFKAVMYNPEKVLLRQAITPPYDVISPAMREKFVARSPYNVVNIDLPVGDENRYEIAGNLYNQWKTEGILVQSEEPAFYLYEQVYDYDNRQYVRTGFVGALRLSEFGEGQVFPHERTLAGPKVDRYELMKASKSNFSQIFGLYQDAENRLGALFSEIKKTMPTSSAIDDDGVKHSLWEIDDADAIDRIQTFMENKPIYIADGHHRYETAIKYRNDMRAAEGVPADETRAYDYVMMMLVNFMDEGLKVFPTHRVVDVAGDYKDEDFVTSSYINDYFHVKPLADINAAKEYMQETAAERGAWVYMGRTSFYGMKIKSEAMDSLHAVYREIDTYLLEELVLKGYYEFTMEKLLAKQDIHFIQTYEEIAEYQAECPSVGFVLHSEGVESLKNVSEAGLVMPQKSTYFYPKLATGLVFKDL